jgi:hypothetical protein
LIASRGKGLAHLLAQVLGKGVIPHCIWGDIVIQRQVKAWVVWLGLTKGIDAGEIDDTLDAGLFAGELDVGCAVQVCIKQQIFLSFHIIGDGSQMDDGIHAVDGAPQGSEVADIAREVFVIQMVRLGFDIHGADCVTGFEQALGDPMPDAAGAAGD